MKVLLQVENLHLYYGAIYALQGIDFTIGQGEIVALIGSNGAGKSSTLKAIVGLHRPQRGEISFAGKSLKGLPTHRLVKKGIAMAPEGRHIFPHLTVKENLNLGAYLRRDREKIEEDRQTVFVLFPRLKERLEQLGGTLSGGEQQMLAIARAYMARPKLLLLDEPSLGLAPLLVEEILQNIVQINQRGTTILLVEQNAHAALKIANRGIILTSGRVFAQGSSSELLENSDIKKAYLGSR